MKQFDHHGMQQRCVEVIHQLGGAAGRRQHARTVVSPPRWEDEDDRELHSMQGSTTQQIQYKGFRHWKYTNRKPFVSKTLFQSFSTIILDYSDPSL